MEVLDCQLDSKSHMADPKLKQTAQNLHPASEHCSCGTGDEQVVRRRKSRLKCLRSLDHCHGNQTTNQETTSKSRRIRCYYQHPSFRLSKSHLLLPVIIVVLHIMLPMVSGQSFSWKDQPTDTSVREGEGITIPCAVHNFNENDHKMEWRLYPDNDGDYTMFINTERISAPDRFDVQFNGDGYSLQLTSATRDDDSDLRCGIALWDDTRFRLTILVEPSVPTISLNKSESDLQDGDYLELRCSSTDGNPAPSFTWYRDDIEVSTTIPPLPPTDKYGTSESVLIRQLDKTDHMTSYRCDVENEVNQGQPKSYTIQLQVKYAPLVGVGPYDPRKVIENTSVTLTCNVDANPSIPDNELEWLKGESMQFFVNGRECKFDSVTRQDSDLYTCRAVNSIDTNQSSLTMDVLYGPQVSLLFTPELQDGEVVVEENQPLNMTCLADANPTATNDDIRWYTDDGTEVRRGPVYYLDSVSRSQSGNYYCSATTTLDPSIGLGQSITDSKPFTIRVLYLPGQASISVSATVIKGEVAQMTCSVDDPGDPPANFSWTMLMFPFRTLPNGPTLTFVPVELSDTGEYKCTPSNVVGNGQEDTQQLDVNEHPEWLNPELPEGVTVLVNASLQVVCRLRGKPLPDVTWLKDGVSITTSTGLYSIEQQDNPIDMYSWNVTNTLKWQGSARLPFSTSLSYSDAGNYTCHVENTIADIESHVQVTIHYSPHVEATSTKVAIDRNQSATMSCLSHAAPQPTFDWYNSSTTKLVPGERITILTNELSTEEFPYTTTLVIADASTYDLGTYSCRGCNIMGCNDANIDLTVKDFPDTPTDVTINSYTWESIDISWTEGFDGGYPQTFEINLQYFDDLSESYRNKWELAGTKSPYNVTGLYPSINYTMTVYSENALGRSDPSSRVSMVTDSYEVPTPSNVEYDPDNRLLSFTSPSTSYCAKIDIQANGTWQVYAECAPAEAGSIKIADNWGVEDIRVSLCLTRRQDVCSAPVYAEFLGGDDLSKDTIIIVGCTCGGVVVILTIVLIVLCCKRKQAKEQYDKQQHDSSPMQPVISNPTAIGNHDNQSHKPNGGVDNPSLDQVDTGNGWHGNRPTVYTTDTSGKAPAYKPNGYPANGYPVGHLPNGGHHWDDHAHYDNRRNMDIVSGSSPMPKNKIYLDDSYQGESTTDHSPHNMHNESGVSTPDPQKPRKVIYEVIV